MAEFTPDGQEIVTTITALDEALEPLSHREIVALWLYFREVAKARRKQR
jgi:hypothetical protein